ncbi:MAG: hypothetical protein JKY82_11915 [Rhizobiaceae bacterium]|nr:hypothetical protein [Rhizobiaceae bacterium]MBL4733278.1 hypothetical protein [Rhizobiaceae bacterium]
MAIAPTSGFLSGLHSLLETLYIVFLRGVALVFVYFALQYWMRLIGIYDGPDYQFDTMAEHWRVAAAVLAVLLPITALGLWGLFSWGPVVWIFAICIEVGMHMGLPQLFGEQQMLMLFHAICLMVFLVLQVAKRFIVNKS